MSDFPTSATVVIANGASVSNAIDVQSLDIHGRPVIGGIIMPTDWTAANLTFQGSHDNSTFVDCYKDDGNEYVVTAAGARFIFVDIQKFAFFRYLKIRSGTAGAPVNQGAERTIRIVGRDILSGKVGS